MPRQRISRTQSSLTPEKPLAGSFLSRSAMRSMTKEATRSPAGDESNLCQHSQFNYDFTQVPVAQATAQSIIQLQLRIGTISDRYEQEADRVATQKADQAPC